MIEPVEAIALAINGSYLSRTRALADAATAVRSLHSAGFVIVPIKPTAEMIEAWSTAHPDAEFTDENCARADWEAMIEAAPNAAS